MPYHEREGRSKLSVVHATACASCGSSSRRPSSTAPSRLARRSSVPAVLAAAVALDDASRRCTTCGHRPVLEWMIYRFLVSACSATPRRCSALRRLPRATASCEVVAPGATAAAALAARPAVRGPAGSSADAAGAAPRRRPAGAAELRRAGADRRHLRALVALHRHVVRASRAFVLADARLVVITRPGGRPGRLPGGRARGAARRGRTRRRRRLMAGACGGAATTGERGPLRAQQRVRRDARRRASVSRARTKEFFIDGRMDDLLPQLARRTGARGACSTSAAAPATPWRR